MLHYTLFFYSWGVELCYLECQNLHMAYIYKSRTLCIVLYKIEESIG